MNNTPKYFNGFLRRLVRNPLFLSFFILFVIISIGTFFLAIVITGMSIAFNKIHPDEVETRQWIQSRNFRCSLIKNDNPQRHIRLLDLAHNDKFVDTDILHLKMLSELRNLDLSYTGITDKGISYINELKSLENLNLSGTNITDEGLSKLSLPNLEILKIDNTPITNKGTLGFEDRCPNLEFMSIGNTPLHDNAQRKRLELDKTAEENGDKTE